jgi:hypothetical protein
LLLTCESKTKGGVYVTPLTMNPASWRKSSYSGGEGGNCIEVRSTVDAVRDSKRPDGAALLVSCLPALIEAVKVGQFDG